MRITKINIKNTSNSQYLMQIIAVIVNILITQIHLNVLYKLILFAPMFQYISSQGLIHFSTRF